jgi:hypothetical protein
MKIIPNISLLAAALVASGPLAAHTTYGGAARNLGPGTTTETAPDPIGGFSVEAPYFKSITNQTVSSGFGWAAGTRAEFGDAHRIRAFRLTLAEAGYATIQVKADAARGTAAGVSVMPAFSLYSGLLSTGSPDYDTAAITSAYLATLGGPAKAGAFNAIGDWKMGNDASLPDGEGNYNFDELSSLTYLGNAADGTTANFGFASGIQGDGVADHAVEGSFWLAAGDYTLIVGGAELGALSEGPFLTYGVDVSLTVIPEPSSLMLGASVSFLLLRRRR